MELFKMAKEAMAMKSKFGEMDKKLKSIFVDTEHKGIKIQANAKCEFLSLELPQNIFSEDKDKAQKLILDAFNEASKKSQEQMAQTSKEMMGGMNIPGLS
ncbi:MAG: YbaB/EbfC family nucleoid-associated protein [Endomicrobium sp.]|jgi:DNA-binding protein YbaB|nr:YbaB/EbfC family nucleoid-associated protein [Endomicrobium sp.]